MIDSKEAVSKTDKPKTQTMREIRAAKLLNVIQKRGGQLLLDYWTAKNLRYAHNLTSAQLDQAIDDLLVKQAVRAEVGGDLPTILRVMGAAK
jgi:hypothetical protein